MNWDQLLSNQRLGQTLREHEKSRSAFEQDYDRIIFSHPFRRLQDKTQVHPLPEHDFVHTRLTHSLEVSSVGRSLGKIVGQVVLERSPVLQAKYTIHDFGAIVAAAALAHDIGNPPFGHSGEDSISEFFKHGEGKAFKADLSAEQWMDMTNFEGNAQGFRILNKERFQGIRLTYATLAAFSKYPRQSLTNNRDTARRSQKKYGFFQTERDIFEMVAEATGLPKMTEYTWGRHPLAFLVEAADDICYHLIDLEDGWRLGLVSYNDAVELFANILKDKFDEAKLKKIDSRNEQIGTLRALAISRLITECTELFLSVEADLLNARFDTALTDIVPSADTLKDVINISVKQIYRSQQVMETEAAGFEVLPGLLEAFTRAAVENIVYNKNLKKNQALLRLLPVETILDIKRSGQDIYQILMHIVDFVSGMTDRHAIATFRMIRGISLPNG